jgi:hypothetical protein
MNKTFLAIYFIERKKAEYDELVVQLESYDKQTNGENR